MKTPPSFDFYPNDFISGTYMMSAPARGAYVVLLCYQWSHGSLPMELKALSRIAGVSYEEMDDIWPELKTKFITIEPNDAIDGEHIEGVRIAQERMRNDWCEQVLKYTSNVKKWKNNGKKGGRPKGSGKKPNGNQIGYETNNQNETNLRRGKGEERRVLNKKKKNESLSVEDCLLVEIPPDLRTQDFTDAWELWIQHKQASKKPWKTAAAVKSQLTRLAASPVTAVVPSIHEAISRDWEGIHILDDVRPLTDSKKAPDVKDLF